MNNLERQLYKKNSLMAYKNSYWGNAIYGEFHPGRELTAIELENFWFAVKPISVWIYFEDFCAFVYVSIFNRPGVAGAVLLL